MPHQELTFNIPQASCLVWVVDGQADGSNVLQSLWRERERVITNDKNPSLVHSLAGEEEVTGREKRQCAGPAKWMGCGEGQKIGHRDKQEGGAHRNM